MSYNYFSRRNLELKLEQYGASKKLEKTKGFQTSIQDVTLKITSCRTTLKKRRKKHVKILYFIGKTNNLWRNCPWALHKL
jgi:hypothetical protein